MRFLRQALEKNSKQAPQAVERGTLGKKEKKLLCVIATSSFRDHKVPRTSPLKKRLEDGKGTWGRCPAEGGDRKERGEKH